MKQISILAMAIIILASSLAAEELPQCLQSLPVHTRAFAYGRDLMDLPPIKLGLSLAAMRFPAVAAIKPHVEGEFLLALLEIGKGDNVVFLYGMRIRDLPTNWKLLRDAVTPFLERERIYLPEEPHGQVTINRGRPAGFLASGNGWLWFSNSEAVALKAAAGAAGKEENLNRNRLFTQLHEKLGAAGPILAYADLEPFMPIIRKEKARGHMRWMQRFITGLNIEAARGVLVTTEEGRLKGIIASDGSYRGAFRQVFGANRPSPLAARIPRSSGLTVRIPMQSGTDFVRLYKEICGPLDADIFTEFETELAEFKQANGVDLEQDILARLKDEAVICLNATPVPGRERPEFGGMLVCGLADRTGFEKSVTRLFQLWKTAPIREEAGTGALYIKGPAAIGITAAFAAIGKTEDVRGLLTARGQTGLNTIKTELETDASALYAVLNTGLIADMIRTQLRAEPGDPEALMLNMLLPMMPKAAVFTSRGEKDFVHFSLELTRGTGGGTPLPFNFKPIEKPLPTDGAIF